jgi:hypothetical protein
VRAGAFRNPAVLVQTERRDGGAPAPVGSA